MPTRQVIGTIKKSDGSLWANGVLYFKLNQLSVDVGPNEVFPRSVIKVTLDSSAELEVDLWVNADSEIPCYYDVTFPDKTVQRIVVIAGSGTLDIAVLVAAGDTTAAADDPLIAVINALIEAYLTGDGTTLNFSRSGNSALVQLV